MQYTELFRSLREGKGLSLEQLSRMARCHRNTVVNVESGRSVKFKTIADLMVTMGYAEGSSEMRTIALLWLESVTGIPFSQTETEASARKAIFNYSSGTRQAAKRLHETIARADLSTDQINLLTYAAQKPEALHVLEIVRGVDHSGSSELPQLKVAEPK